MSDGKLWLSCEDNSTAPVSKNWCTMVVLPTCHDQDCTYELRVHRSEPIPKMDEQLSWEGDPDQWIAGTFTWSDEFVPVKDFYYDHTPEETQKYMAGGTTLDIHIDEDGLRTRGFVRRAKEEYGIIVEPANPTR